MSRILILGSAPLPLMNAKRLYGTGIRTWQFAMPLLKAGHEVKLVVASVPGAMAEASDAAVSQDLSVSFASVEQADFERILPVKERVGDFRPDAIVAAGYGASRVAVHLGLEAPIWADFFGDPMAEAQSMASVCVDDEKVFRIWSYIVPVLDRADRFSAVSERQLCAVVGQLAARGRLNRWTLGVELVFCLPCGIVPVRTRTAGRKLRGKEVPEDAFLILWSGGYNTWADGQSLFEALVWAMERNPTLHFVSTGGKIDGHDERTYPEFQKRVASSALKDRFHLCGWVDTEEVSSFYAECDVGINVDRPCYEAFLGSRNRILDWMAAGLPVLTTETCELSRIMREENLGFSVPAGDPERLGQEILRLVSQRATLRVWAEKAKAYAETHFSFEATTRPLVAWAAAPAYSPDRGRAPELGSVWATERHRIGRQVQGLGRVAAEKGMGQVCIALLKAGVRRCAQAFREVLR